MQTKLKKSLPIVAMVAILVLLVSLTATLPSLTNQAEAQENDNEFFKVLSGTSGNSGEGPANLFDGKKTEDNFSKWCANGTTGTFIIKAQEPITISSYTFYTANDNAKITGRNPKSWNLAGCNDYDETTSSTAGGWYSIHAVSNDTTMQDVNYTGYTFTTENMRQYKYYMLQITANQGNNVTQLGEIEFTYSTCEHNFVKSETNIQATCTEPEYELHTCSVCQETRKIKTSTNALGHDWVTESTVDATCTEAQKLHQKCSRCEGTQIIDGEPALGHSYDDELTTEPTCTKKGEITHTCTVCGDVYTESVDANGHSWEPATLVSEATCTQVRVMKHVCSIDGCDASETYSEGYPLGHEYVNGTCIRCGKASESGVEVGAFTVIGGTKDVDYKYETSIKSSYYGTPYNVLTILTSTRLTIANTDPTTATYTDRIEIAYGVSANITLAGVNIDLSWSTYDSSNSVGDSPLTITDNSAGDVVITLADGTVNYLYGGKNSAGLQKNSPYGSLTINGTGTVYAYGGQGGAGIGSGKGAVETVSVKNITIEDCTVIAKGSRFSGGTVAQSSGNYTPASGIGSGRPSGWTSAVSYNANIRIINAIVTAEGVGSSGIGPAGQGHMEGIIIEGGSVLSTQSSTCKDTDLNDAIGGLATTATAPVDEAGDPVALLKIANPNGALIKIESLTGTKYYTPIAHSSSDTNVYAYLKTTGAYTVYVGGQFAQYEWNDEAFSVLTDWTTEESGPVKAFTVTAAGDTQITEGTDYTYTDGVLTILSATPMVISSNGIATTDRIVISADNAKVTLNNVNIDVSSYYTTGAGGINAYDSAMSVNSNGVYIYLAEGSVNTLKSGTGYAGLQLVTTLNDTTFIQGISMTAIPGVLNAYGGEGGAGIGGCFGGLNISNYAVINAYGGANGAGIGTNSGSDSKYHNISINNSNVLAVGGDNGAGIGLGSEGVIFANGASMSLSGSTISAIGGKTAPGIGAGKANVEILNATIYALGGNETTTGYGISGNKIIIKIQSSINAVGGLDDSGARVNKFSVAPVNSSNGALALLVIANPNGEKVKVDNTEWEPYNSAKIEDTNLYLYVTEEDHTIAVGETSTTYYYIDGAFHVSSGTLVSGIIDGTHYHWYSCADEGCEAKINSTACTEGEEWLTDDDYHWHECSVCGQALVKTAHTYDQKVVADKYRKSEATCTANALYYYSCVCGHCNNDDYFKVEGTALGHDFDNSTKYSTGLTSSEQEILGNTYHSKQCDRCGILQIDVDPNAYEEHQYATTCSADCLKCGYKRSDEELVHNWSTDWTSEGGNHYHKCLNDGCTEKNSLDCCNFKDENGKDNYEIKIIDGKYSHGRVCTVCNAVDTSGYTACTFELKYDDTNHWEECSKCGYVKPDTTVAHTFDNACDTDCNGGCGYTRDVEHDYSTAWVSDNDNHWHECTRCHDKKDVTAHTLVKCYDDTAHWEKCTVCEKELTKTAHSYNNGEYTCNGCSYIKATPLITDEQPRLNFTYSGYEVGGNAKNFKVASDKDNFGIKWDDNAVCGDYWWIIADLKDFLTDWSVNSELYTRWRFNSFGNPSDPILINSYFRPNTKYWVGLYLEVDDQHYFEDFEQGNVYIEGLGYPVYVATWNIEYGYVYAYFELPELTGEEPEISSMSDIEFELTGNYTLGESILTTDVTGKTVFNFEVAPSGINRTQALEYYTTFIIKGGSGPSSDYYAGVFEKDTLYSVEITVFAPEGYDFTSYGEDSITLKIGNTVYNAQAYYIYCEGKCGVVDYYFDLPLLGEHEHTWIYYDGYQNHYRYCECGYWEDWEDHVYDDDDDCDCNKCGYIRNLSVNSLELTFNGYEAGKKVVDSTVSANAGFEKYITKAEFTSIYYLRGGDYYDYFSIYSDDSLYLPGEVYNFIIDVTFGGYEYNKSFYAYYFKELTCSDIKVYIEGYGYVLPNGISYDSDSIEIDVVLPAVADSEECGITKISDIEYTLSGAQAGNKLSDLVLTSVKATGVESVSFAIYDIANDDDPLYTSTDGDTELTFDSSTAYGITITCTAEEGYTFTGIEESSVKLNGAYEHYGMMLTSPQAMSGTLYWAYSFLVTDEEHTHRFSKDSDDYVYDETYHWMVCECGQKSAVEEHDFVNGYCVKCDYENKYNITSVALYIKGYKYYGYARDVDVLCDDSNIGIASDYLVIGTSDSIWYGDESCKLGYDGYFDVDTKYYLFVSFYSTSGSEFVNLTVDDVTLEGYGSAEKLHYYSDYGYALFALSELKAPHKHTWTEADKVEAVPATCAKQGSIEYYLCSTCGKAVNEEGKELTHYDIITDINSDNHTYKIVSADYVHGKVCSGCGKTSEMGYHYYTDGKDDICDYEGCGHQREPLVNNLEFSLSGYVADGKITDFEVIPSAGANGIVWPEIEEGNSNYKWGIVTNINTHLFAMQQQSHGTPNYACYTANGGYFLAGCDYWLLVMIKAEDGYRVDGLTAEDVYITGVGVGFYIDTYYIDSDGEEVAYVYFKLPALASSETGSAIRTMPKLEFEIEGYELDALDTGVKAKLPEGYPIVAEDSHSGLDEIGEDTLIVGKAYRFSLTIWAAEGYTFYGFTEDDISVKAPEGAVLTSFVVGAGYTYAIAYYDLPSFCDHSFGDWADYDTYDHGRVCASCGYVEREEHVYDDDEDYSCNECGHERELGVSSIEFTLSGYEIDKFVSEMTIAPDANTQKYVGQVDIFGMGYLRKDTPISGMTQIDDPKTTRILPDLRYILYVSFELATYGEQNTQYVLADGLNITINGVDAILLEANSNEGVALFELPVLEGTSAYTTVVTELDYTVSGYAVGEKVSELKLIPSTTTPNVEYDVYVYKVTEEGNEAITDPEAVFECDTYYLVQFFFPTNKSGYLFDVLTKNDIKIEGSGEMLQCEFGVTEPSSQTTGIGVIYGLYSLPKQEHVHKYSSYTYADSHGKVCSCGDKIENEEHVYDDVFDLECNVCGYTRTTVDICNLTLYLFGYHYGAGYFVNNTAVESGLMYVQVVGYYFATDKNISMGYTGSALGSYDLFEAGVKHYLFVGLESYSNSISFARTKAEDITLSGYGSAIDILHIQGDTIYVTFELPELTAPHVHEGTWYDEVPATCVATGTKAHRLCDTCNKYFDADGREISDLTIAINPDAHSFGTWYDEVPATCVATGTKGYKDCSLCHKHFDANGNVIDDLTIVALGHKSSDWITDQVATCTEAGTKHKACTVCGDTLETETIVALGHEYGEWTAESPATCVTTGTKAYQYCSRCQKYFDANDVEIDDIVIPKNDNHDIATEWTKTQDGHYHACKRAGCTHQADFQAHTPDRAEPTEYESQTCTVCGYVIKTALGHTHKLTLVPAKSATCLVNGTKAYYACSGCEAKFEDENGTIAITDFDNWVVVIGAHAFGDWTAEKPATCISTGVKGHKDCVYCNKHFDENGNEISYLVIPVNDNHDIATEWTKTQDGHYYVCTRSGCNHTTTLEAHTPDRSEATTEYPVTCTVCGYIITPALGHTHKLTLVPEVPATCTTDGTKAYYACSGCEAKFEDSNGTIEIDDFNSWKVITGTHSYGEWIPEVSATCKEAGTKAHKTCATCGKHFDADGTEILSLTIAINPSAHGTSIIKVESVPATAAMVGNIVYYRCTLCGKLYADESATVELDLADTIIPKIAPTIVSGANAEWVMNSDKHLTFKSDALRSDFISIAVDGNVLGAGSYAMGLDGLSVSLPWTYLETLTVGEHTVEIRSESGTAVATFTVIAPKEGGLSVGAWVGIGFGIAGGVALIAVGVWFLLKYLKRRKTPMPIQTEAPVEPEAQSATEENSDDKQ